MLSFSFPYRNLILQASLCLALTLILTFLKIPIRFLHGLFTYIHPDSLSHNNISNGVRAAIRRPEGSDSSHGYQNLSSRANAEQKRRNKSKQAPEFDENNAQIFRLKLDEAHLQSRLYFDEYRYAFTYSILALSCLLLQHFLDASDDSGMLENGVLVPVLLGFLSIFKVFKSLVKVSFERSASKRSDKQLSVVVGVLGCVLGLLIFLGIVASVLDFEFELFDGVGRLLLVLLMGCIASLLYMPGTKCARSFWLGTDQLNWNLSIISCGWIGRIVLYANYLLTTFTSFLWISPLAEILVNKNVHDGKQLSSINRIRDSLKLVGNVGMLQSDFGKLRIWCLLVSGLLQTLAIRQNLQMYLNEAVLSWYQRLHASKVPDLDYSRAKVFLHNHYLCLAVVQFFAPSALMLLFVGLSQIEGDIVQNNNFSNGLLPLSALIKEAALFLAWWTSFVWTIFTSVTLVLHRRGIWYVS